MQVARCFPAGRFARSFGHAVSTVLGLYLVLVLSDATNLVQRHALLVFEYG